MGLGDSDGSRRPHVRGAGIGTGDCTAATLGDRGSRLPAGTPGPRSVAPWPTAPLPYPATVREEGRGPPDRARARHAVRPPRLGRRGAGARVHHRTSPTTSGATARPGTRRSPTPTPPLSTTWSRCSTAWASSRPTWWATRSAARWCSSWRPRTRNGCRHSVVCARTVALSAVRDGGRRGRSATGSGRRSHAALARWFTPDQVDRATDPPCGTCGR